MDAGDDQRTFLDVKERHLGSGGVIFLQNKYDADGSVTKWKASLVIMGVS